MTTQISSKIMTTFIDTNILNILRCQNKCICYQYYDNKHLKLSNYEINEIYQNQNQNNKWCFTNYDGTRQFKKF